MLRGFRWQLLLFLMTLGVFLATLFMRLSNQPTPLPQNDLPTPTPIIITPTPEPQPTAAITATPSLDAMPTFREALVGRVQRLNPLLASLNPVDHDITSLIFEGLTRTNLYGEVIPALAKSWIISNDALEYVIILRDDVLWQDGLPFTAADVVYTVGLLQDPNFPGSADLGAFWRTIEIQPLGEHLIRFRLTQPLASFLDQLRIGILPEHALRGTTAAGLAAHPFNFTPIGTGAYQLERLRGENGQISGVDLRVAPVYRQRPEGQSGYAVERLSFRLYDTFESATAAFNAGEVDGLAARSRDERDALLTLNAQTHTSVEPTFGGLIYNWARDNAPYFKEQRVRVALQTALNRAPLINAHMGDEAILADSPLPLGSWAYRPITWAEGDVAGAQAILKTVNFTKKDDKPADGTPTPEASPVPASDALMQFNLLVPNEPSLVNLATGIASQWAALNVVVQVEAVDADSYQTRLIAGDFDTALVELAMGASSDPDVYAFWDQSKNYGNANDRRIAEALERARRDSSGINRAQFYSDFQQDFITRAIAIPLYYPLYTYVTASGVSGVQLGYIGTTADRFATLRDWTAPSR